MKIAKNITILIFFILLYSCDIKPEKLKNTKILIETLTYDFGEIPAKKEVSTIFNFENIGEEKLQIWDVKTSCGCTVPQWTKEKIRTGGKGEIKVTYDAKYSGRFQKTITVFYNGKESPKEIIIKGTVDYPKE